MILATLVLFSVVGCKNDNKDGAKNPTPVGTVADSDRVYVDGMLHKVNVTETNNIFTQNKQTEYQFVLANDSLSLKTASEFILAHVREATGATLTYAPQGATWSTSAKYIVLGDSQMYATAGLTVPTDDIGSVGYYIKTAGNSVFIMAKNEEGYQLGAIAFLRHVIGYDMLSADIVVYEKDGKTLPNMDIVERPDYSVRITPNGGMVASTSYGMGFTKDWGLITVGSKLVHNSLSYIPTETYLAENPEWYSDVLSVVGSQEMRQLCYTAHGDDQAYQKMIDTIMDAMMPEVIAAPEKSIVSFTQQDVNAHCKCESCLQVIEEYGAYSAALIMFCNDLGERLDEELTKLAIATGEEKREVKICFFAYHWSEAPPIRKNADGEYEPINGLVCRDNVAVFIASIETKYYYTFYHEINEVYAENMRAWTVLTDTILLWLYQANYGAYLYPYDTWDIQPVNYRFGKTVGADLMFSQGQANVNNQTGFMKLKAYIDSKMLFDVNTSYNDVVDKYFKYYFGPAGQPMRQFFNEVQAYMKYLEKEYHNELTGYIRDEIDQSKYWPYRTIAHWLELFDEAYAKIEEYKTTDPLLYEKLYKNILLESLFPRYAMCTLHTGAMSAQTLQQMRQQFYEDATSLDVTNVHEAEILSTVYQNWGVM